MEPTEENIEKVLQAFYRETQNKPEINKWLIEAQISPQAWIFSWKLLQKTKPAEVQFFGACCLHAKISRYWQEVAAENVVPLRAQLFEHIVAFATGPRIVLNRLCIALSAFALHTMPEVWPNAVQGIVNVFQQHNMPYIQAQSIYQVLLEILKVLPEEFATSHLSPQRRGIVRNELQRSFCHVRPLLQVAMTSDSTPAIYEKALLCFSSWVQFGIPLNESEPFVLQTFTALCDESLFDTAVDALISVFSHNDNYRYPNTMQKLLPQVLTLKEMFHQAIHENEMDKCQGLARLVVNAADSCVKLLLTCTLGEEPYRNLALSLVNVILEITAIPGSFPVNEWCSDLTFGFWYNLQDEILESERSQYQVLLAVYTPVYMSLVDVLLQKGQYTQDEDYQKWTADEKEQHRCYRQDIADALMNAHNLLKMPMLEHLCQLFGLIVEKSAAEQVRWQEIETVLFALGSIADTVDLEECNYLPTLFRMLSRVPYSHPRLISQALHLIGNYAEWIGSHPEVLGSVIPLLLQGLTEPDLVQSATLSLKEVLQENQEHIGPFVAQIFTASKTALDGSILKVRDVIRLMACLGYVLSVLPVKEIMEYLDVLLVPHVDQLRQVGTTNEPSASTKATIMMKIHMLSSLFSSLNIYWDKTTSEEEYTTPKPKPAGPQPVLLVIQKVLPVLKDVLKRWVVDAGVVEGVCDTLKKALKTLMDDFKPLALDVTELVVHMYNIMPQRPIVDFARQLMVLFASAEEYRPHAAVLFHSICNRSLQLYESGIREDPELAAEFMIFLSQCSKKNRNMFMTDGCNILGLFQAGVISLGMPEGSTVKAACSFLNELINLSEKNPAVKDVVVSSGYSLVERMMRAIGGDSPRAVVDSMADVFLALNKHCFEQLCAWMNVVVNHDGFPCSRASQEDKQQFSRKILMQQVNKRKLKEAVSQYTLLWRGMFGTDYAAQTTSIMLSS